jgi:hypothetical protein
LTARIKGVAVKVDVTTKKEKEQTDIEIMK